MDNIIYKAAEKLPSSPADLVIMTKINITQYTFSMGNRVDNTPDPVKYLRYMDAKELCVDVKARGLEPLTEKMLSGNLQLIYSNRILSCLTIWTEELGAVQSIVIVG